MRSDRGSGHRPGESRASRWPTWRIALLLYPLAMGAVAINLFLLALMGQAFGLAVLAPVTALVAAVPLAIPAALWFAKRIRTLMDVADGHETPDRSGCI